MNNKVNKEEKMVKLTYEYVKNYIEIESKSNYKLISTEYIGGSKKLKMICDKGHNCEISFSNFKFGKRCGYCKGKYKSYEYVKNYFEKYGFTLLSDSYKDGKSQLSVKCPKGHIISMSFNSFHNSGTRCKICSQILRSQNQLLNYDYVKNFIEIESNSGCKLISTNYRGNDKKLTIKCACGNEFKATFIKFASQGKHQCNECGIKIRSDMKRCSFEEVYKTFKDGNCLLLSDTYHTNSDLLHYVCECGKESYISLNNFKTGQRCKECGDIRKRDTLFSNGTAPCSRQQRYLHQLFGGELNYPVKTFSLDIAFPEEMIYLEYDGGGHDLSVKYGNLTTEEFVKKERNRTYYFMRNGWKSIRIISSKDKIPSDEKLLEMLDYSRQYLSDNHHYIKFDIDNHNIKTSQFIKDFDFGVLRVVKSGDI